MKTIQRFACLFVMCSAVFLAGCDTGNIQIDNLTPTTLSENPSNIYTISVRIAPRTAHVIRDSVRPHIVIDGETHPMRASGLRADQFEFEHRLPGDRQDARYFFLVNYQIENHGIIMDRESFSAIQNLRLTNRYPYSLEVTRAPVGAEVGVIGRGFTRGDTITVGGATAPTSWRSSNSIRFHVPPLRTGENYLVQLVSPGAPPLNVGTLHVDAGFIRVAPSSLDIRGGERAVLVFSISTPAPAGGLVIDVTTDVPDSVIMPEVVIAEGERSVSITVEGGQPGSGEVFVEMPGYESVRVPVRVR